METLETIIKEVDAGKTAGDDTAAGVWEEYEETFAADPYTFALNEIERVIGHAMGLIHQLTEDQVNHLVAVLLTKRQIPV